MPHTDDPQRLHLIAGLRALAGWLEANPLAPVPLGADLYVFPSGTDKAKCAEVDRFAALFGAEIDTESLGHGHYSMRRHFGPVTYSITAISNDCRARHKAAQTYADAVTPDTSSQEV
ncbi:hypothetical protein OG417_07765 [Actinoallomurus sp. NBC_01490]|uniref:hypothetical protein n=1 Tax=Actinoallomurus sp. NBC_01490 TaxID=2903557 RepID=UPI002E316FBB|nr:hypothetical protein [Actinoallomurus sp. NBC_01490]